MNTERSGGAASAKRPNLWKQQRSIMQLDDELYMQMALNQARTSYEEGGCPIGGVLVDNRFGKVLGEGHNSLVQESDPIIHGEMAALRDARRMKNRHNTTLYTTLQPCFMCAGAIAQFGIPRVVIGDTKNASGRETIIFLQGRGVEVVILDPQSSAAAGCIELAARFKEEKPDLWLEDWGGGPNPRLIKAQAAMHSTGERCSG
jgi:cytosine/creatinine deaminase